MRNSLLVWHCSNYNFWKNISKLFSKEAWQEWQFVNICHFFTQIGVQLCQATWQNLEMVFGCISGSILLKKQTVKKTVLSDTVLVLQCWCPVVPTNGWNLNIFAYICFCCVCILKWCTNLTTPLLWFFRKVRTLPLDCPLSFSKEVLQISRLKILH